MKALLETVSQSVLAVSGQRGDCLRAENPRWCVVVMKRSVDSHVSSMSNAHHRGDVALIRLQSVSWTSDGGAVLKRCQVNPIMIKRQPG